MILLRGFEFGGAIEFQDGVDSDFPDSLGEGGLLCADDEFALGIRGCGVRPRRLHGRLWRGCRRKSASLPKAAHRCQSVRDLGQRKASGRGSQDKKLLFWGDRNDGGARTGRVREQSRSFAAAGRRKGPEAVPRRTDRTRGRNRTDHHSAGRSRRRNSAIQTIRNSRASFWKLPRLSRRQLQMRG